MSGPRQRCGRHLFVFGHHLWELVHSTQHREPVCNRSTIDSFSRKDAEGHLQSRRCGHHVGRNVLSANVRSRRQDAVHHSTPGCDHPAANGGHSSRRTNGRNDLFHCSKLVGFCFGILPMVVCPTTYGVSPTSTVVLPSTISESVSRDLIAQLAVYTDQQGSMKLLGPTGWSCAANYGADGSGGVQIYPSGEPDPVNQQGVCPEFG